MEVSHSKETTRPATMARQGRNSRLGLERLELLARWEGGGGRRGGVEEGGGSPARGCSGCCCCLKKGRRERFREGTWEGSRERLRDRGFLPASWRNSGEARRAAGWTGGQQPRRRRTRTKARFARCVKLGRTEGEASRGVTRNPNGDG